VPDVTEPETNKYLRASINFHFPQAESSRQFTTSDFNLSVFFDLGVRGWLLSLSHCRLCADTQAEFFFRRPRID